MNTSSSSLPTPKIQLGWAHMPRFGQGYSRFAASSIDWTAPLPQPTTPPEPLPTTPSQDAVHTLLRHSFWSTVTTLARTQRRSLPTASL